MRIFLPLLACLLWASTPAAAQGQHSVQASYEIYAGGLNVAAANAIVHLDSRAYRMELAYHTTGLLGLLFRGEHLNKADGLFTGTRSAPQRFSGTGIWRGQPRAAVIEYQAGLPNVVQLVPPNDTEREPVPLAVQANSVDSLSAIAAMIRHVQQTGQCDGSARVYDGRRASDITARTAGQEIIPPSGRSLFAGRALRCDFEGRLVAGFRLNEDRETASRPLRGSAWLAEAVPGTVAIPVRLSFETRWFGESIAYLTAATRNPSGRLAQR